MRIFFVFFCLFFVFVEGEETWAKNMLSHMSIQEKIGQLFVVPICSLRGEKHKRDICHLIEKYHIGGVIVIGGDPFSLMKMISFLQKKTKIPLFVAQDAENGLGMRMKKTIVFPKNLTLGAIQDDHYIYLLAKEIGKQMHLLGFHINFAPVVDVNTNPENPIIHMRSFGDDEKKVARKSIQYIKGLKKEKIFACAKHFPGHGDTFSDSHKELPFLAHDRNRLEKIELYPFKKLIENKIDCVMVGHLDVPSLTKEKFLPSSLSKKVVKKLLRKELNFHGLIISDALNMKALTQKFSTEEISLKAFLAGIDILLYADSCKEKVDHLLKRDIPLAMETLIKAFEEKKIQQKDLDAKVFRILQKKQKMFFPKKQKNRSYEKIWGKLSCEKAEKLKKKLFALAISSVHANKNIPLNLCKKIGYFRIGQVEKDFFYDTLSKQKDFYLLSEKNLFAKQNDVDIIVVSFFPNAIKNNPCKVDLNWISKIRNLQKKKTIIVFFGSVYSVVFFDKNNEILVAFEKDKEAQKAAANILLGKKKIKGHLPISFVEKKDDL